jgi:hypothetical protein
VGKVASSMLDVAAAASLAAMWWRCRCSLTGLAAASLLYDEPGDGADGGKVAGGCG